MFKSLPQLRVLFFKRADPPFKPWDEILVCFRFLFKSLCNAAPARPDHEPARQTRSNPGTPYAEPTYAKPRAVRAQKDELPGASPVFVPHLYCHLKLFRFPTNDIKGFFRILPEMEQLGSPVLFSAQLSLD